MSVQIANTSITAEERKDSTTMTKMEFCQAVADMVGGEVKEIEKANGVKRISVTAGQGAIRPTIYVGDMYDNGYTVSKAVDEVNKIIAQPTPDININGIADYRTIKEKLRLRLYSSNTNAEVYRSAEEYGFDDLILIPYIQLDDEMAINVTQNLLDMWQVPYDILFADAMEMTEKTPDISIKSMYEILCELSPEMADMLPSEARTHQYVISSRTKLFAAIGAITKRNELAERFPNGYYVLPSSIHECIIMPKDDDIDKAALDDMVAAVNKSEVKPDQILGWHAYEF